MEMKSSLTMVLALCAIVFSNLGLSQECSPGPNGVCEMRTPLRTGIQAIAQSKPVRSTVAAIAETRPVRSAVNAMRPANWRVFNSGVASNCSSSMTSCSGASASCSGYVQSDAPLCEYVPSSSCSGSQAIPYQGPFNYYLDGGITQMQIEQGCQCPVDPAYQISPPVAEVESVVGTQAAGFRSDRVAYRRTLKKATQSQVAQGKMTSAQAMLLNALSFSPNKCDEMMAAIHDAAIDEGLATTQAIDWDGLASFIERIMPILLQLIQLFGSVESMLDNVEGIVLLPSSRCFVALRDGSSMVLAV